MKQVLEKQTVHLAEIAESAKKDRLLQLSQVALQAKADNEIAKERKDNDDRLDQMNNLLKKGLFDENGKALNSNVIKLFKEVKGQAKTLEKMSKDRVKDVTKGLTERPVYKTIGERLEGVKQNVKNMFSVKGVLNAIGIGNDPESIVGTAINRRAARKKYAEQALAVAPQIMNLAQVKGDKKKALKMLGNQFDKQQDNQVRARKVESEIKELEDAGFTERQIAKTGLLKQREEVAQTAVKLDPRLRIEEKKETAEKSGKEKLKEGEKKTTATREKKNVKADEKSQETLARPSQENMLEAQRAREATVELLKKIEENTRAEAPLEEASKKKSDESKGGSLLDGIFDFVGSTFKNVIKAIFNPRNLLKAFTKVFVPAMIVGSLFNGIVDAFKAFIGGGSFTDVIIAGLGGVLEFLSFGLFDAESLKKVVEAVDKFVTEYIIDPIAEFFKPISEAVSGLFTQMQNFVQNIGIPEISFTLPVIGKKLSIGPFYPFKKESTEVSKVDSGQASSSPTTSAVDASSSVRQTGNVVYNKSAANQEAAGAPKESQPVIISAPVTNNQSSSTNVAMPAPIRNEDLGYNAYRRSAYGR